MTDAHPDTATEPEGERSTFASLGLPPAILRALDDVGYETPSAIQAETIPLLLAGRDLIGLASTGTGKTAAFALPVLSAIDVARRSPQALVLTPTRELAVQVCEAFERYAAHLGGVHVLPIYGGQGYGVQLSALRRGVHVVVGTPGRIMDHLAKGTLDLTGLTHVVLDEADEMLRMGFAEDVDQILEATPAEKQVALFSATMPRQIRAISQQHLRTPAEITVKGSAATSPSITQRALMVSYQQKLEALTRVLEVEPFEAAIVFTRTRNETETVAERLRARGYAAAAISGDVAQPQREKTIEQLRSGDLDVLVATDVAARGLDVERISHVINYDLPIDTESYVHRIGRTGRAGRTGDAISFVTPRERRMLGAIEKATRGTVTVMPMPSAGEVNTTRLTRFDDAITAALTQGERIERFREIIAHYVAHHDVPQEDVAAALAVVAQGETPLLLDEAADRALQPSRPERERGRDRDRDSGERPERGPRRGPSDATTYRLAIGSKRGVEPRQIVGALANEGGLGRDDFGRITIRFDFTLVELPELDEGQLQRLRQTRILGVPIDIRVDSGRRERPERGDGREPDARRPRRDRDDRGRDSRGRDDRPPRGSGGR